MITSSYSNKGGIMNHTHLAKTFILVVVMAALSGLSPGHATEADLSEAVFYVS